MIRKPSFSWFKLNRTLHRDIGYFCIGLTIIFAVSGIAVNHIDDWNPNYAVERSEYSLPKQPWLEMDDEAINKAVINAVGTTKGFKSSYWSSAQEYRVFLKDGSNLTLNIPASSLVFEEISPRYVLQAFNRLHLNESHKSWVIFSDIYAVLLLFLAVSALFMVKGKNSPWRKKSVYLIAGLVLPALFILL